jgi:DNA-directed RNA polymerase specialized sigma24 family protein
VIPQPPAPSPQPPAPSPQTPDPKSVSCPADGFSNVGELGRPTSIWGDLQEFLQSEKWQRVTKAVRLTVRRLGLSHVYSDIEADLVLRLVERVKGGDRIESWESFAVVAGRNLAIDHLRRQRCFVAMESPELVPGRETVVNIVQPTAVELDAALSTARRESQRIVLRLLSDGLSVQQVALVRNQSVPSVLKSLRRLAAAAKNHPQVALWIVLDSVNVPQSPVWCLPNLGIVFQVRSSLQSR